MKYRFLLVVFLMVFTSVASADERAFSKRLEELSKQKSLIGFGITVDVNRTNKSNDEKAQLAETIEAKLEELYQKKFDEISAPVQIVDRKRIKTIIEEQKFTNSGLVDTKNVIKLGKLAGVDIMMVYTANNQSIIQKFIDVESGIVLFTKTEDLIIPKAQVLINSTINIYAGEIKNIGSWNLPKDAIVNIKFNSNKPNNMSLLSSDGNDLLYSNLKDAYNGVYSISIPSNDSYVLTVQNKAIMFPSKVTLNVSVMLPPSFKVPK